MQSADTEPARSPGPSTDEASDGSAAAGTSSEAASSTAAAGAGYIVATSEARVTEVGGSDGTGADGSSSTSCEPQLASAGSGEAADADAPLASEQNAASSSGAPAAVAAAGSSQPGLNGSHPTIPAPRGRVTTTWHTDKLRTSRELMIYHLECSDEALLGTLVLQPDHKLDDVLRMLHDELEVDAAAVSRGTMGSSLKVPIHKNQYAKSALHFFPSKRHCLLVMEFDDDEDGSD